MDINLHIQEESPEDRTRIIQVASVLNFPSENNPFQWFKLNPNIPMEAKPLAILGLHEEAFFRFGNICSSQCLKYHPLLNALIWNETIITKHFLKNGHLILLESCKCYDKNSMIQIARNIPEDTLRELADASSLFKDFVEKVFKWEAQSKELHEQTIVSLQHTAAKYYKSGSVIDMSSVLEALFRIKGPLDRIEIGFLKNGSYANLSGGERFRKLPSNMNGIHIESICNGTDLHHDAIKYLIPYMNQPRKNTLSWEIFFKGHRVVNMDTLEHVLKLGGDLYATDDHNYPWIICLLARTCWINHEEFYPKKHQVRICSASGESFITQPCKKLYLQAKVNDKWRIETHRNRSKRFRDVTKTILLCLKKISGECLPKPVAVKLMEYVLANDVRDNPELIEPDELKASYTLICTALYLETYGEKTIEIAIMRKITTRYKDHYGAAEALGLQIVKFFQRNQLSLPSFMSDLQSKANSIMNRIHKTKPAIFEALKLAGLKESDISESYMDIPVNPTLKLAFHHTVFGLKFDEPAIFPNIVLPENATEPVLKRLKVESYK